MGTAQLVFEGEYWGATGSHKTGCHVTESRVTGSVFCACTPGSWSISALLGPFYLLIGSDVPGSDVTGSGRNWIDVLRMPGFLPRYFLLTRVPWLPNVTKGHLTPSGFHWVCACATGSYAISAPDRKWRLFFLPFFIFFSFFFSIFFHINLIMFDIFFHKPCSTSNNTTFCTSICGGGAAAAAAAAGAASGAAAKCVRGKWCCCCLVRERKLVVLWREVEIRNRKKTRKT